MEKKYCRICWNSANWTKPTGEAAELEASGSYVADNGLGLEEWLFDMSWPLRGYRGSNQAYSYGFLQPIGKYRGTYVGQTTDVCLYTVDPTKQRLFVGTIRNLYVPDDDECAWAVRKWIGIGRLAAMNADVRAIGIDDYDVGDLEPYEIINVRFRSEDVEILEPRPTAPPNHVVSRSSRYQPLNWDGVVPPEVETTDSLQAPTDDEENPERNEDLRHRSAVAGTQYSPSHVRLQNALYRWLKAQYGAEAVDYEKDFVDLTVRQPDGVTFYEIKTAVTAKGCIREAVGQLLEYGHYSTVSNASRLVVVGAARPTPEDQAYLNHLRRLYSIPLSYQRWSWEFQRLDGSS